MRKVILKNFSILIVVSALLASSGCVSLGGKKPVPNNIGGVYKTINKGVAWQNKSLIPTVTGKPGSIAGLNVAALAMDPSDNNTIYYGSIGSGLLYTYNGGESWQVAGGLGASTIRAISVDPKEKCTVYATIGNRIFKTEDCSRGWEQKYFDNATEVTLDAIQVDHFNNSLVYAGISRGDLIKSSDQGESWQTIHRFGDRVKDIIIDPNDSRIIYVTTVKKGIFRSLDLGSTWQEFNTMLKDEKIGLDVKDIVLIKDRPELIFAATSQGILRSDDSGATWNKIILIQPEKQAIVNALVVNPQNTDEIFYVTNTTFFISTDGGVNWTPVKLPTARAGWKLLIDPVKPNIIYMGVRALQ